MPSLRKKTYQIKTEVNKSAGADSQENYTAYTFIERGLEVAVRDNMREAGVDTLEERELLEKTYFWEHMDEGCPLIELCSVFRLTKSDGSSFASLELEQAFFKYLAEVLELAVWKEDVSPIETFNQAHEGCFTLEHKHETRANHRYVAGEMRLFQSVVSMKNMRDETEVDVEVLHHYQHASC